VNEISSRRSDVGSRRRRRGPLGPPRTRAHVVAWLVAGGFVAAIALVASLAAAAPGPSAPLGATGGAVDAAGAGTAPASAAPGTTDSPAVTPEAESTLASSAVGAVDGVLAPVPSEPTSVAETTTSVAETTPATQEDAPMPAAPVGPTSVSVSVVNGRLELSWAAADGAVNGYRVLRDDVVLVELGPDARRAVDDAVPTGRPVTYRVLAFGPGGDSSLSASTTITSGAGATGVQQSQQTSVPPGWSGSVSQTNVVVVDGRAG
jgi:hypothetical protein